MDQKEIVDVLAKHAQWLNSEDGERADLSGADLSGANLGGADLGGADLSGADLSGANLGGADLSGADLSVANLSGANLSGANLSGANLSGTNLSGTNLSGANLPEVAFESDLPGRILAAIVSEGCRLDMKTWHVCETTHCLAGWATTLHSQGKLLESLIGPNAAGALIFNKCVGSVPDFFSTKSDATKWLNEKAAQPSAT